MRLPGRGRHGASHRPNLTRTLACATAAPCSPRHSPPHLATPRHAPPRPATLRPVPPRRPRAGNGYVEAALRLARAADPKALLFINEYGAEDMGPKSERMYGLVKDLKARGVPLDGVGLQAHSSIHGYANATQVAQNIARLGALGLQVHVTELDCECPPKYCNASDPNDPGFATQARIYGDLLEACLNNTGVCTGFSTWGFTDKYSWTNEWCMGNDCQSLPFDRNYTAKSAFNEMLAVLNNA